MGRWPKWILGGGYLTSSKRLNKVKKINIKDMNDEFILGLLKEDEARRTSSNPVESIIPFNEYCMGFVIKEAQKRGLIPDP